tara:strand:- start:1096 stop:1320 length:225 start_codon:yes stop_codon:yes gene_type:complete
MNCPYPGLSSGAFQWPASFAAEPVNIALEVRRCHAGVDYVNWTCTLKWLMLWFAIIGLQDPLNCLLFQINQGLI